MPYKLSSGHFIERILAIEHVELVLPPQVGFNRNDDIRSRVIDDAQQAIGIAVRHQHIDAHDAQGLFWVGIADRFHFLAMQRRERKYPPCLIDETSERHGNQYP
ncbi:MAG: hypothetical protein ACR2FI_06750 [Burkholderiales bacterium]